MIVSNKKASALSLLAVCSAAAIAVACGGGENSGQWPKPPPGSGQQSSSSSSSSSSATAPAGTITPAGGVEVLLCDGKTKVTVPSGTPGTSIAGSLMAEWLAKHPGANWEAEEKERHTLQPAADNKSLVGQVEGQTYGRITEQDVQLWKVETERVATAGSRVFHNAEELGSTVGVSCDMCHPHAANTHPETYPKFQVQLGRVALLRDMINWCIEHPVRGKPLASDDSRMRALEAYIIAQRKGKTLEYGKH
jgi:thiosulfate dehydrogenase